MKKILLKDWKARASFFISEMDKGEIFEINGVQIGKVVYPIPSTVDTPPQQASSNQDIQEVVYSKPSAVDEIHSQPTKKTPQELQKDINAQLEAMRQGIYKRSTVETAESEVVYPIPSTQEIICEKCRKNPATGYFFEEGEEKKVCKYCAKKHSIQNLTPLT